MISHVQLLQKLNLVGIAEPLASQAYERREKEVWEKSLDDSPHGEKWHTSFHASSFPGDAEKACPRKALYGLMGLPSSQPSNQHLRAIGDVGKAIEDEYVTRWEELGVLLSNPPSYRYQSGFVMPDFWLSGNVDAVIRPHDWNRGHPVDIKSKDHDVVDAMKRGQRTYDTAHYFQVQTYLGCLRETYREFYWDYAERLHEMYDVALLDPKFYGLTDPPDSCSILYVSRNRPRHTHEFVFDFDEEAWRVGTERLRSWKEHFLQDELPERPKDWRWLEHPCQYCDVKKICKADDKAGVTRLSESCAEEVAQKVRPSYSYTASREAVLERWNCR